MTNNRTNEPTIEAAARVIYDHSAVNDEGNVCQCGHETGHDLAYHQAERLHAADLLAKPSETKSAQVFGFTEAQVRAARAEYDRSEDMERAIVAAQGAAPQVESGHQHEGWMIRDTGSGGYYCSSCGEPVADPHAPVLDGSTVDEDEILTGLRESFIDGGLTENTLAGFWIVEIPLEDALPTLAKRFAEWLKGQGR